MLYSFIKPLVVINLFFGGERNDIHRGRKDDEISEPLETASYPQEIQGRDEYQALL